MRFPKFASPLVAILAVALAAPIASGCAAPTGEADGTLGTQTQAEGIRPGDVTSGASAALQLVQMFKTYQKYGELTVTTGEILDKVNQTQADVDALRVAVSGVQESITTTDKNVVLGPVVTNTNVMSETFQGYVNISKTGTPAEVQNWLDNKGGPDADNVEERWAALDTVNQYLIGKNGVSSALLLIAQTEAAKGDAGIDGDAIGRFMADKRLTQERYFFVLSKASANNKAIDLELETAKHQTRMAEQDAAFYAAMAQYNTAVLDASVAARKARISACGYAGGTFAGIETESNASAWFAYNDSGVPAGAYGQMNCETVRNTAATKAATETTVALTQRLYDAEQVFRSWTPRAINIESASLTNGDTNVTTNLTGVVGLSSQGKIDYTYSVDAKLGLSAPVTFLSVRYNCGPGTASVDFPTGGAYGVQMSCSEASIAQRIVDATPVWER